MNDIDSSHWFLHEIADYVWNLSPEHQEESIQWLKEMPGISVSGKELTITDKKAYFSESFELFQEGLKKLRCKTLEEYAGTATAFDMLQLMRRVRDKFDIYVLDSTEGDDDLMPISDFLRFHKDGEKFFLGSVLDYHY